MRHRTSSAVILMGMALVLAWPATATARRYRRSPTVIRTVRVAGPVHRLRAYPTYRVRRARALRRVHRVAAPYRARWARPAVPLVPPMLEVGVAPIVGVTVTSGYPAHRGYPAYPGYRHYAEEVVVDCHW